jgi:hypothetical protein
MGYITARGKFQQAKDEADTQTAMEKLADGLVHLTRAIEKDMRDIKATVSAIKSRQ